MSQLPFYNVQIHNTPKTKLYNVTRKNIRNLEPTEGRLFGLHKLSGKYIVNVNGHAQLVSPHQIEFLKGSPHHKSCKHCRRISYHHTQKNLLSTLTPHNVERTRRGVDIGQNQFIIAPKTEKSLLHTSGLATCAALQFDMGSDTFLSHLSATSPIDEIVDAILEKEPARITKIKIWAGIGGDKNNNIEHYYPSRAAVGIAKKILKELKRNGVIVPKTYTIEDVCYAEMVPPIRRSTRNKNTSSLST